MRGEMSPTTARGNKHLSKMLTSDSPQQGNSLKAGVIAGVVLPFVFIVLLAILVICYIKRRKSNKKAIPKCIGNIIKEVRVNDVNAVAVV